jgi:hypothetical protein
MRPEKQNAPAGAEAWFSTCASVPDPHMLSSEFFLIREIFLGAALHPSLPRCQIRIFFDQFRS